MHARSALRRGLSGVAAVLTVSAAMAGAPAHAAEQPSFFASFQDLRMGADGSPGKAGILFVSLHAVKNPVLTIDSSDLAGVATVATPPGCSAAGTTVTCPFPSGVDLETNLPLVLHPAPGSKAGDSGPLRLTTSGDNIATQSGIGGTVTLADGIDMVLVNDPDRIDTRPGQSLSLAVTAVNAGDESVDGVRLAFRFDYGIDPQIYDNCTYGTDHNQRVAVCDFDEVLAPGDGLELVDGFGVSITKDSPKSPGVDMFAQGLAEAPLSIAAKSHHEATTGRTLKATTRAAASASQPPADIDDVDNFGFTQINVFGTHVDLAALGATASGGQGDVVTVAVAAKNLGPSALDSSRAALPAVQTFFTVPPSTTAVGVPQGCSAVIDLGNGQTKRERGKPGEKHYACWAGPSLLPPGTSTRVTFSLRIDTVITGATGKTSLVDTFETTQTPYQDDNPANDTADVVINPAGGTGGGGLPVTGAPTAQLAAAGAVVLLVGGFLLLLARRRRTA